MLPLQGLLILLASVVTEAGRIGDGWGANFHWLSETTPGEAAMMARAFKVARTDLTWSRVEQVCGVFDFSVYDALVKTLTEHGIQPYLILDYGNPCYPPSPGNSRNACDTPECVAGYGRYAQAIAARYGNMSAVFECQNEPDGLAADNYTTIARLCLAAGSHFSAAGEIFVGPSCSGFYLDYMEHAFQLGLLDAFTAVSVHPYRASAPDEAMSDFSKLRMLIEKHAPTRPNMPMMSSEWGYTSAGPPGCSAGNRANETGQGHYLARMWLANLLSNVSLSIAYDWHDDGSNPGDCESNFGSVRAHPTGDPALPFTPKPMYIAAITLQDTIGNADTFDGRVPVLPSADAPPTDLFVLQFSNSTTSGGSPIFSAWTNATKCLATPPPSEERINCGYCAGCSRSDCDGWRCCWDPSPPKGASQCFFGIPIPAAVSFAVAPALANHCWSVFDTFGAAAGHACASAASIVSVSASEGPVYLL